MELKGCWRNLLKTVLDLIYPRSCAGCGAPVRKEPLHICWDCLAGFNVITDPFCALCGDPVDGVVEHEYNCSWCQSRRPYFDLARSAAYYKGALRTALHSFKYEHVTCLSRDFVPLLSACVNTHYSQICFDAVTFVPLYPKKERKRTYNQAKLLAKELAKIINLPLLSNCLYRVRHTLTQTDLTAFERRVNVLNAFHAEEKGWLEGRNLLLVDDVMTTGSTVNECANVLKRAGAAHVYVVTVARG